MTPTMQRKKCPVCAHIERSTINGALGAGLSPRSLVRRYAGLARKAVQKHRDGCLGLEGGGRVSYGRL